jgi:hypothetical protein
LFTLAGLVLSETHEQIRARMRGIAPVVSDFVRDEIRKVNTGLAGEVAQLKVEKIAELRAKAAFDERIASLEAKLDQPRSNVRRIA